MEMITGAAATTYGGAYGGALVARGAEFPEGMQYQRQIGTTGNTGTQGRLNVVLGGQNWNVRGNHSWNDGYRDHEWNQRWHLEANFSRVSRGNHFIKIGSPHKMALGHCRVQSRRTRTHSNLPERFTMRMFGEGALSGAIMFIFQRLECSSDEARSTSGRLFDGRTK